MYMNEGTCREYTGTDEINNDPNACMLVALRAV